MKIALYSVSYAGIWYDGPALSFEEYVKRAKACGYDGIELDGKRPHGNPMDLDSATRKQMRSLLDSEGIELPCVAANNDFSSPIPEHRECQMLMVREQIRLAAELGAGVVRLFAAWPGVGTRDGLATYDFIRGVYYTFERQYPFVTWLERWNMARDCIAEMVPFAQEYGVTLVLQNHAPLLRHWKDCYDMVAEVNSPWLKVCLDLPILERQDPDYVREAATTVGAQQAFCHFGGEYKRAADGSVQQKRLHFDRPVPDYTNFLRLMDEIGYDHYMSFELCHPVVDEGHRRCGLEYVHEQVQLAREFMTQTIEESQGVEEMVA